MQLFRRLAKNIFFKIVLVIVALSFVLFGISGFISGMSGSWVLKIGSEKVSASNFEKALNLDKRIVRSAKGSSPEVEEYLNSEKFKSEVASRLIRKTLIQKISKEIGAFGSKKLILEAIAKDSNFQNKDGNFDDKKFVQFLKQNGLDEERYFQEVKNEVSAGMIMQTISMTSPVNFKIAVDLEEFNQQKRIADVVVISKASVGNVGEVTEDEISKYYNENKASFKTKELREVSYVKLNRSDFFIEPSLTEQEVQEYYEKNKQSFVIDESKDFYHIIFESEESANEFLKKYKDGAVENNGKQQFVKIAKEFGKTSKDIDLQKIVATALPQEISADVNKLKINEISQVIKSKIGFHVFLLNNINPAKDIPFAEAKDKIRVKLMADKTDKVAQESITKINDSLMSSKNLEEFAQKNNFQIVKLPSPISIENLDSSGSEVLATKDLPDFSKNVFDAKEGKLSKLFGGDDMKKFYAFEVAKIVPSRDLELKEVRSSIIAEIVDRKKTEALKDLAMKVQKEITDNPAQALNVAYRMGLKVERSKLFPRVFMIDLGTSKVPYKNQFLDAIFEAGLNKATEAVSAGRDEYLIGIVRDIKKVKLSGEELASAKQRAVEGFANDVMIEYNDYLQKKYPIDINKKFFGQPS